MFIMNLAAVLVLGNPSPPDWYLRHLEFVMAGGGAWITDNHQYKSPQEPFDHYLQTWKWGLNRQSLVGRLAAVKDGVEAGTIWQFRVFWHPVENRAVAMQWGADGTFLQGTMTASPEGVHLEQTVYAADGSTQRSGHRIAEQHPMKTESFTIDDTSTWTAVRTYLWVPRPSPK